MRSPAGCVQILSARLRILANPVGRGLLPGPHEPLSAEDAPHMAPDILKGVWRLDPLQRSFLPRLRCLLGPTVAQPKHKLAGKAGSAN